MTMSAIFLARLPEAARRTASEDQNLEHALVNAIREAHLAWPGVRIPHESFIAHVAGHASVETGSLAELRTSDLYLSCACALGDAAALTAFEQAYFVDIDPALVRMTGKTALHDEVAQSLRTTLFAPRPGRAPQIALYAGRGDLRNWTRAAIVRATLNLITRKPRETPAPTDLLSAVPAASADPELAHMKEIYQAEFRDAFAAAVATLDTRERNLLRHAFVDGLSIDEVGALFGVHRATAARWLASTRTKLMGELRRALMQKLHVDKTEFASIMRLIRSQLNVSLARFFHEPPTRDG
jgi:RNA polymerase sigma-70 factor (ECF subfamily)